MDNFQQNKVKDVRKVVFKVNERIDTGIIVKPIDRPDRTEKVDITGNLNDKSINTNLTSLSALDPQTSSSDINNHQNQMTNNDSPDKLVSQSPGDDKKNYCKKMHIQLRHGYSCTRTKYSYSN